MRESNLVPISLHCPEQPDNYSINLEIIESFKKNPRFIEKKVSFLLQKMLF